MPDSYTATTKQKFFAFFRKYGMYFVQSVTLGGRLIYYSAVEKQENETTEHLAAEVKLAYKALSGGASANWTKVNKELFASSRTSIETLPPGTLNSATPAFGDDLTANDGYQNWVTAAKETPGIFAFHLAPMADLFPFGSPKQNALLLAREDLGESYIYTQVTGINESPYPGRISVKGVSLVPDNWAAIQSFNSWQIWQVIVDRHTFEVKLNKAYGVKFGSGSTPPKVSGDMLSDIQPFNNPDYILVIASMWRQSQHHNFFVCDDMTVGAMSPKQRSYFNVLRTAGADSQLDSLLFKKESNPNPDHRDYSSYVFVGVLGSTANLSRESCGYTPYDKKGRDPKIAVSFELLEKNGSPYYTPIL